MGDGFVDETLADLVCWNLGASLASGDIPLSTKIRPIPTNFSSLTEYEEIWRVHSVREAQHQIFQTINSLNMHEFAMVTVEECGRAVSGTVVLEIRADPSCLLKLACDDAVLVTTDPHLLVPRHAHNAIRTPRHAAEGSNVWLAVCVSSPRVYRNMSFVRVIGPTRLASFASQNLHVLKIDGITSWLREVRAIGNLSQCRLLPHILQTHATPPPPPSSPSLSSPALGVSSLAIPVQPHFTLTPGQQVVCGTLDPSQQQAVVGATEGAGFTLIQGPPGTGKTTVLKALLNLVHLKCQNEYYEGLLGIATAKSTDHRKQCLSLQQVVRPHILVTAPSNNAVDNIVSRIVKEGFRDSERNRYFPDMVRFGKGQSVDVSMVSLEEKVASLARKTDEQLDEAITKFQKVIDSLQAEIVELFQKLRVLAEGMSSPLPENWEARVTTEKPFRVYYVDHHAKATTFEAPARPISAIEEDPVRLAYLGIAAPRHTPLEALPEFHAFSKRLVECEMKREKASGRLSQHRFVRSNRTQRNFRQALESSILSASHLVFTTLNSAGANSLMQAKRFQVVVVDEAGQSVEPESLVALQRVSHPRCILIGDPQQLPPTVLSDDQFGYARSLFERLMCCGVRCHLLQVQYRMHPMISAFPSAVFYSGRLKDGPKMRLQHSPIHAHPSGLFKPLVYFDVSGHERRTAAGGGSLSLQNAEEARFCLNLFHTLARISRHRICVLTPYSQQVNLLRQLFAETNAEISSIDGFQGRECEIVIFSCVRASLDNSIGFLSDVRRMNVALTRAQLSLFIVGRAQALRQNTCWKLLEEYSRARGAFFHVPSPDCQILQTVFPTDSPDRAVQPHTPPPTPSPSPHKHHHPHAVAHSYTDTRPIRATSARQRHAPYPPRQPHHQSVHLRHLSQGYPHM